MMTPERFRQVRNLFEAALEKAPAERGAFLEQAAATDGELRIQVQRMLDAHTRTVTFLDGSVVAPSDLRTDPRRMEGRHLGPYEILREVGRGGMGTVYLARRADGLFQQQVAIKLVTPDTGSGEVIQRFEQERSILASLEHPNIARLYDGGATEEGWPYFVMEYVEGKPIDSWCDEHKLNISDRLRLFRTVCGAVHYAHQHRVIHRDLKPGNILVTEDGTVKLLDFGIAKLVRVDADEKTALATRTGLRLMTPEYASPEQIRGEASTPSTDLYSLGVILYELVTGRRPYRLKSRLFHEIVRVVCEQPPTRPSTVVTEVDERPGEEGKTITIAPGLLSQFREGTPLDLKRRLSGDLDGVVLKALEKEPRRRYRSVEQMSSDVERHLSGQPVLADQAGRLQELTRAASQHRLGIVLAGALLIAFVTGGVRIDWRGIALIAAAGGLLAFWRLATDREFGAAFSERMYGMGGLVVILILFGLLAAWRMGIYFFPGMSADLIAKGTLAGTFLILLVYMSVVLGAWTMRARWAGSLVCSMRTNEPQTWALFPILMVNSWSMVRDMAGSRQRSPWDLVISSLILLPVVLGFIYGLVVMPVLEVRDRGIIYRGRLYSWLSIERYEWEQVATPQDLVILSIRQQRAALRLHVRQLFTFLPPPRIRVPAERQDELEAILKRHLSDWPEG